MGQDGDWNVSCRSKETPPLCRRRVGAYHNIILCVRYHHPEPYERRKQNKAQNDRLCVRASVAFLFLFSFSTYTASHRPHTRACVSQCEAFNNLSSPSTDPGTPPSVLIHIQAPPDPNPEPQPPPNSFLQTPHNSSHFHVSHLCLSLITSCSAP